MNLPLIAILGPTAVGKTAVGISLAERLEGEIISCDSVQVYRGLNIGSAKPTPDERYRVKFHLIDVVDPDESYDVASFKKSAERVIADIRVRGHVPILIGGTGLYAKALLDHYSLAAAPSPELRARIDRLAGADLPALYRRLQVMDPVAGARIHPNDRRRIVRALEVYEATGQPITHLQHQADKAGEKSDSVRFGLMMPREQLYRRIEERVERMMAAGLVAEVRSLLDRGYSNRCAGLKALGYRQVCDAIEGRLEWERLVPEIKKETRQFAKRQMTWFRADPRIIWIEASDKSADSIAGEIINQLNYRCHQNQALKTEEASAQ
ncbi:MAG: tRNA (adenosine(37)-N6)-dimethylallyltransferase MiaA [Armatimonadetes bacterium]|nr:tRNA (adenosine(37)-N6)-dimethylallyltransferase MiaA [Armatimonadota bacterium]